MEVPVIKRNPFQRLLGRCVTRPPADPGCWKVGNGHVDIDLSRAPELVGEPGAVRLEGAGLDPRILVFRGGDGEYHAVENKCKHGGRRLDPVPGSDLVQCCSVGKSTFDYGGRPVYGAAKAAVSVYCVRVEGDKLVIDLG
jgi:nitrite reductase/ring-hydroxylating ferredoxin subunit